MANTKVEDRAEVTCARTSSNDGEEVMMVRVVGDKGWVEVRMTLDAFARAITGQMVDGQNTVWIVR